MVTMKEHFSASTKKKKFDYRKSGNIQNDSKKGEIFKRPFDVGEKVTRKGRR